MMARTYKVKIEDNEGRLLFAGTPATLLRLVFSSNGGHMVCGNCGTELAKDLAAGLGR